MSDLPGLISAPNIEISVGAAREPLPGIIPELLGPIDLASWIARR
jgi:hypothetical protein